MNEPLLTDKQHARFLRAILIDAEHHAAVCRGEPKALALEAAYIKASFARMARRNKEDKERLDDSQ